MALEIFKLVGSIFVDSDAADKSLQKTDKNAENVGKTLLKGMETAAKWSAALVSAGTATASALYAVATKTASNADEIDKMSQKLGLSREAYQEWDYILSQAGMDVNDMQAGIKKLSDSMADAQAGSEKSAELFNKVGISLQDLNSMSREEIFAKTIQGLQGMEDNAERAALANDLLGRSGQNLTPLLNSTAKSTEELKNKAHELGMIMSDEAIDNGVQLTDTIDTLKRSFEGIFNEIGSNLIPIVQEITEYIIEYLPEIQDMFDEMAPIIESVFETLVPSLMELAQSLIPAILSLVMQLMPFLAQIIEQIVPIYVDLLQQLMPILMQIIQAILPVLVTLITALMPLLEPLLGILVPIADILNVLITPLSQLLNELLPPIIEVVSALVAVLSEDLTICLEALKIFLEETIMPLFEDIPESLEEAGESILDLFTGLWEGIQEVFGGIGDWFFERFTDAWTKIKAVFKPWGTFFSGLWKMITDMFQKVGTTVADAISGSVKAAVNAVIGGAEKIINGFISAINACIGAINAIPGVKISKLKKLDLPKLAKGGSIDGEGSAIVGEAGAELIDLPKGAKVTPLNRASGEGGSVEDKISLLCSLMQELINTMPEAVAEGVSSLQVQWNDRELGRMVKAYE